MAPPLAARRSETSGSHQHRAFGAHTAWLEGSDVFCIRFSGPLRGAELRAILDWQRAFYQGKQAVYALCDLTDLGYSDSEARRILREIEPPPGVRVVSVCYGASLAIRVLNEMVRRAWRLLRGGAEPDQGIFVATEAEARALIEKLRSEGEPPNRV